MGSTVDVAWWEKNVVKDAGDVEGLVGVCDTLSEDSAEVNEGSLVSLMDRVPNSTGELPKVGVEVSIGGNHIEGIALQNVPQKCFRF